MSSSSGDQAASGPDRGPGFRRSVLVMVLVGLTGLTGTALAGGALHRAEEDRRYRALNQRTALVTQVVTAEVAHYVSSLSGLAAAIGAQSRLEAAEFGAIMAPGDRRRLPGATGVSFIVPAATGQVAKLQAFWRARGSTGLTLRPETRAGPHRFAVLSLSLDDGRSSAGLDLSSSGELVEAMTAAEQGHQVAISRTYWLRKDAGVPVPQRQLSFVLVAPVYSTSPQAPDAGRFRGWLALGLRGGDFLREAVAGTAGDAASVLLQDGTASGSPAVARWLPPVPMDDSAGVREVRIPVPQRTWLLRVQATQRLLADYQPHLSAAAWLIGAVLTGLLLVLTATVLSSRNRALRRVAEATGALRRDIARREEVEHRLRLREEELVRFAGVVAHDLRSPLARIMGYADFLHEEAVDRLDDTQRGFLGRLRTGADHMSVLLDDLLDYATADNRPLADIAVDLQQIAATVVADRVGDGPATVVVETLPAVRGDPTLLRQVFDNLIGNAVKYTPAGRTPHVRVSCQSTADGHWRFEVADNGIGIPAGERGAVFDAFTRADGSDGFPGTGLGLAIVARIVERHHGRVGVDADPGGGSIFWFTLPVSLPAPDVAVGGDEASRPVPAHQPG